MKERTNVLGKMKADIKLYGFKTTDFKAVLASRKKRGLSTVAGHAADEHDPAALVISGISQLTKSYTLPS